MSTTLLVRKLAPWILVSWVSASAASAQGIFAERVVRSDLPAAMQSANTPVFAAERASLASSQSSVIGGSSSPVSGPRSLDSGPLTVDEEQSTGDSVGSPVENKPSVRFHPRLSYRYQYGDGVPASPGHVYETGLHEITPGILIEAGDHWTLDYAPTWAVYTSNAFEDATNHAAVLNGGGSYVDWTWGFSQSFGISHDVLLETAAQTFQETWGTNLRLARHLNSKVMIDTSFQQSLRYVETAADTKDWSNLTWLHYNMNPRLNTGFGLGGGYLEMEGPDVYYFQVQGRVSWKPTERLSLSVNAGADRRFSYSDRIPIRTSPIYGAALSYHPFPQTTITLNGNRAMQPSYSAGELIDQIDWGVGLSQRLLGRFNASVRFSRGTSDYVATTVDADPNRSDDFTSFDARLSTAIREHGSVSIFYRDTDNESSSGGYSTTSTQVGIELGFRY